MTDSLKDLKEPSSSIDSVYEEYQMSGVPDKTSSSLFGWSCSIYLSLLSIPLIGFPRFLVILLGSELVGSPSGSNHNDPQMDLSLRTLNRLESCLAKLTGFSFITLSIIMILQTGSIPLTSSLTDDGPGKMDRGSPYRQPTIFFMMIFFNVLGFFTWNVGLRVVGSLAGGLGAWGFYLFLFPNSQSILWTFKST
ncbi:hypothetical protein PPACK8108_LOCUS12534 [Phakopsora pachyrhizi]|uniref:Uncharacterized protein n=1 Tax=Phakopsora pachyrhizi TaxID=170000 RepID=A0AAV0B4G9_PHAPC|nr:hypothetical protein PPACK8108_LOCUS12534 [Phakopsora pachyrhizi]